LRRVKIDTLRHMDGHCLGGDIAVLCSISNKRVTHFAFERRGDYENDEIGS